MYSLVLLTTAVCAALGMDKVPYLDHGVDLPSKRPLILSHRGASGMLPEHTAQAYQLAIEQGSDVIECDVALTRDLKFICLHDLLDPVTDVAKKFNSGRMSTYYVPDEEANITGYFSVDFTLEEIKTLRAKQRYDFRNPTYNYMWPLTTLEECIQIIKSANRTIGFYPETKDPEWINSLDIVKATGKTFEQLLIAELAKHGYSKKTDPCFLQSFSIDSLKRMKKITNLPLVFLMWKDEITDADLDEWAKFCYGIGPWKPQIVKISENNTIENVNNVVKKAHDRGLKVHVYTFRNENQFLAWEYGQDPYEELKMFLKLGVDAFFTDFTHTLHTYLEYVYQQENDKVCSNTAVITNPSGCLATCLVILTTALTFRLSQRWPNVF